MSDDSPRTLQPSRSRRKDAISRRNERCRAASDPRRGTSSAASSVLRRPARRAKLLAIRPSRARSYLTSVMAAVPDMSHLTPEERSTIEEVIIRQKQEEEKENEIMRYVGFATCFFDNYDAAAADDTSASCTMLPFFILFVFNYFFISLYDQHIEGFFDFIY